MSSDAPDIKEITRQIEEKSVFVDDLLGQIQKEIVGQKKMVERLLIGLLADGHILLEGVPGLAKTMAAKSLAMAIQAKFQRIQFTPDLLPADLIGTLVYHQKSGDFVVKQGPIFANFILADEINRAPAKVQSALLEAMQERQVTIGEDTFRLEEPFMVLATQNPIEQEGTYPLPEAQIDRFMLKVLIDYPQREEERQIMKRHAVIHDLDIKPVTAIEQITEARQSVANIYADEKIENYILDIVFATRQPDAYNMGDLRDYIAYGASPRATLYLMQAAKCHAFLRHRGFVIPDDIKEIGPDVLRHRVTVTYEAEAEEIGSEQIIQEIFNKVEVP
ncbi:ATPase [candidate division LCP-89 bacterium B3_LCP]|uniref:ATPase n=1 Tax=candidate division LCP-89 bacterium B3_LCP TaxID=2012998 RepID=A0A532V5V9_UNCL8|nr:MAG: ATPase [candidate division LCP-89 bacterium B3_LCP]